MILPKWDKLPAQMQNEAVRRYYELLQRKKASIVLKRAFDLAVSLIMVVVIATVAVGAMTS